MGKRSTHRRTGQYMRHRLQERTDRARRRANHSRSGPIPKRAQSFWSPRCGRQCLGVGHDDCGSSRQSPHGTRRIVAKPLAHPFSLRSTTHRTKRTVGPHRFSLCTVSRFRVCPPALHLPSVRAVSRHLCGYSMPSLGPMILAITGPMRVAIGRAWVPLPCETFFVLRWV